MRDAAARACAHQALHGRVHAHLNGDNQSVHECSLAEEWSHAGACTRVVLAKCRGDAEAVILWLRRRGCVVHCPYCNTRDALAARCRRHDIAGSGGRGRRVDVASGGEEDRRRSARSYNGRGRRRGADAAVKGRQSERGERSAVRCAAGGGEVGGDGGGEGGRGIAGCGERAQRSGAAQRPRRRRLALQTVRHVRCGVLGAAELGRRKHWEQCGGLVDAQRIGAIQQPA